MGTPAFHTFERGVKGNDNGTLRLYCLLSPFEAAYLRTLLAPATPPATAEVTKASLDARLQRTAEGRDPLQSGEQAYYDA